MKQTRRGFVTGMAALGAAGGRLAMAAEDAPIDYGAIQKEIDALPDLIGSETRNSITEQSAGRDGKKAREVTKSFKLRDLTAAYKDLTGDMDTNPQGEQVRIVIDV